MASPSLSRRSRPLRVAFVFNRGHTAQYKIVAGAYEYMDRHASWVVAHIDLNARTLHDLDSMDVLDGVIASGHYTYDDISRCGPPGCKHVFFSCLPTLGENVVTTDEAATARIALDEFENLGLSNVGFCSVGPTQRGVEFLAEARRRGLKTQQFVRGEDMDQFWHHRHEYVATWLRSLPKPIGLLTHGPDAAQMLTAAATLAGIHIPEQVAVLSCEATEETCMLSRPTLSAVSGGLREIGVEAARMLDRLLQGKPAGGPILIAPTHVERRASTDVLTVANPDLASAIRMLREQATEDLTIEEIVNRLPLSRNQLEHGIRKVLNRSPHDELMRVRIETACRLLRRTSLSMAEVAVHSGLGTVSNFCKVFKRRMGKSPRHYRIAEGAQRDNLA